MSAMEEIMAAAARIRAHQVASFFAFAFVFAWAFAGLAMAGLMPVTPACCWHRGSHGRRAYRAGGEWPRQERAPVGSRVPEVQDAAAVVRGSVGRALGAVTTDEPVVAERPGVLLLRQPDALAACRLNPSTARDGPSYAHAPLDQPWLLLEPLIAGAMGRHRITDVRGARPQHAAPAGYPDRVSWPDRPLAL